MEPDYLLYYDTERYLFEVVTTRFRENGHLDAPDFFTILDWKAQRATVYAARRMLKKFSDLEPATVALTRAIHGASSAKERLRILMNEDWGFELPTASAILTVCYPEEFTVYDRRVCDMLGGFHNLKNKTNFENIWAGYLSFMDAVRKSNAPAQSLRDKDRWLWGKSDYEDLNRKIAEGFRKER